jgi:hypothetical protein
VFTAIASSTETQFVTDCTPAPADVVRLRVLLAAHSSSVVNINDAIASINVSRLSYLGYPRGDGTYVNEQGGGLYFLKDDVPNAFNPTGVCQVWSEPLVRVGTDEHWVAFTGLNFPINYTAAVDADPRAVIDGVRLPASRTRILDSEIIEVLLPAFIGRRRLQIDVDGVRSNGVIIVNRAPVVHGFMEWRLGVEDVRGRSPKVEDIFSTSILDGDAGWGGYGAWEPADKCMKVGMVGFHFGGYDDLVSGRMLIMTDDRQCELIQVPRHTRVTCCTRYPETNITVLIGGLRSSPVLFSPGMLLRKPVIQVGRECDPL